MFSRRDHLLGHKTSLNKFKKFEIILSIFSDHNAMKPEINHSNTENHTRTWKLKNMLWNNEWVNSKIKEEIKIYLEAKENENSSQNLWDTGKGILRGQLMALKAYLI